MRATRVDEHKAVVEPKVRIISPDRAMHAAVVNLYCRGSVLNLVVPNKSDRPTMRRRVWEIRFRVIELQYISLRQTEEESNTLLIPLILL